MHLIFYIQLNFYWSYLKFGIRQFSHTAFLVRHFLDFNAIINKRHAIMFLQQMSLLSVLSMVNHVYKYKIKIYFTCTEYKFAVAYCNCVLGI